MLQPPTLRTNVSSLVINNNNNNSVVVVSGSSSSSNNDHHKNLATTPTSPTTTLEDGGDGISISMLATHQDETTSSSPDDISSLVDSFLYNNGPTRMTETRKLILFQVSTVIGTFVFFIFYQFLYQFITAEDESTKSSLCWLLSYSLSIWCQYELHCRIVFGKRSNSEYWRSLIRTYFVYGISMVFSTILNYVLVGYFKVGHSYAWVMSLILVGILNYFTVSKFAFADSSDESL